MFSHLWQEHSEKNDSSSDDEAKCLARISKLLGVLLVLVEPSNQSPGKPHGYGEPCRDSNKHALTVVGDNTVRLHGNDDGQQDKEHDVCER